MTYMVPTQEATDEIATYETRIPTDVSDEYGYAETLECKKDYFCTGWDGRNHSPSCPDFGEGDDNSNGLGV